MPETASDLFSDPTQAQARLSKLQRQLDDLATAMRFALRTKQTVALEMFRGQFKEMSRTAAQLRHELNTSDAPAPLVLAMDKFSDKAIAVAREVGADASALGKGLANLPKMLPLIIGGVAVVALVVLVLVYGPRRKSA